MMFLQKNGKMKLKKLNTRKEYEKAIVRFEAIFQAKSGTAKSDEADVLAMLIKEYEDRLFVINAPDPVEAIKYRMEQKGISKQELAKILGYNDSMVDLLRKTRKLNLRMVRILHRALNIPLETLVKEY